MLKFTIVCLLAVLCCFTPALSENSRIIYCDKELQVPLYKILKLPEARHLIKDIQKAGPFRVLVDNHSKLSNQFSAYWDPDTRTIVVSLKSNQFGGEIIGSILFELHNALINDKLEHVYDLASRGQIDKESFVEAIERLEYQNSLKASKLAERGIKLGIFPSSARLFTYRDFDEHYYYQKKGGHSAYIANNYDQFAKKQRIIRNDDYRYFFLQPMH